MRIRGPRRWRLPLAAAAGAGLALFALAGAYARQVAEAKRDGCTQLLAAAPLLRPRPSGVEAWQYWDLCGRGGSLCAAAARRYEGAPRRPGGGTREEEEDAEEERFLLLETREAGWNNERYSLEIGFALAFLWRRTLVLPPYIGITLYGGFFKGAPLAPPNETFDVPAMNRSVKVMMAEDFAAYVKARPGRFPGGEAAARAFHVQKASELQPVKYLDFQGWFLGTAGIATTILENFDYPFGKVILGQGSSSRPEAVAQSEAYRAFATRLRPDGLLGLRDADRSATALRLAPRAALGNFYTKIFAEDRAIRAALRRAVRRSLHVRPEFFQVAAAAMDAAGLRPGSYAAMHIRLGDWAVNNLGLFLDPARPALFLNQSENRDFLAAHGVIFIASNADSDQEKPFREIFLPALKQVMAEPKRILALEGAAQEAMQRVLQGVNDGQAIVEMIICSQASSFLGTWGSSFTGYIHRLRGYMPSVEDKRILYYERQRNLRPSGAFPSWGPAAERGEIQAGDLDITREWPEAWREEEQQPCDPLEA